MKVGIIGSGTMGRGIAQVAATAGCKVVVFDTHEKALTDSAAKLKSILARLVEKGKIDQAKSDDINNNIQHATDLSELAGSDLVIEAIIENPEIKRSVFQKLESLVSDECIIASNTSSLSIASLAASCNRPERFIGIHFFNPAPLMKLVEIIPAIQTSKETTAKARNIIDSWGKLTVLAKDTPGFIVNRVARPFYGESLRVYEEGIADIATIDWVMKEIGGFRMGPFELMDFIGNDINYTVTETVFKEFFYDSRYKPSFTQKRLSEAGLLGRKSGKGYYDYSEGAVKPEPVKNQEAGNEIFNRVLCMLINEAADALYLGIATRDDIDTAMTKGVNYPKGLLRWADETGIQNCVNTIDALFDMYHEERYRCSPQLRKMAAEGQNFY
ncbi:MAG: 3-hydroxyacyl-CoA dehydrogenase NAD-binding domain-containing protein [Bacteroidota bacterium]